MISDEPDEDADNLDDDAVLENCVADAGSKQTGGGPAMPDLPDWPRLMVKEVGLDLDTETLTWFKSTYRDWRQQMRFVLRAWVVANRKGRPEGLLVPAFKDRVEEDNSQPSRD
jgi:hypothetical protein